MPVTARSDDEQGRAVAGRPPFPPLQARSLRRAFGSTQALDGLDLCVRCGTVVGLVGPNGCGKTTALEAIAGLTRLDAGAALVAGARLGSIDARRRLALVPDEVTGFDQLTVDEYTRLVHALHGVGALERDRAELLLQSFGLESRRRAAVGSLSRGLRRQAAIVAALSLGKPLTLVDEATAALDPEAVVVLRAAVGAVAARGGGVLLATQDLAFAESVCDEIVLVARGRVVAAGPVSELVGSHGGRTLEDAFLAALGTPSLQERVRERLGAF